MILGLGTWAETWSATKDAGGAWTKTPFSVGPYLNTRGKAWSVELKLTTEFIAGLPDLPCNPTSGKIRFSVTDDYQETMTKCLHPNPILQIPSARCPCPNSKWVCIRPLDEERILRIRMKDTSYDGEVVLWQGDRSGVLNDIEVGTQGARFAGPFVRWATMFMGYVFSSPRWSFADLTATCRPWPSRCFCSISFLYPIPTDPNCSKPCSRYR